jgi:hypothetical protein
MLSSNAANGTTMRYGDAQLRHELNAKHNSGVLYKAVP